jgi:hypothetical protein
MLLQGLLRLLAAARLAAAAAVAAPGSQQGTHPRPPGQQTGLQRVPLPLPTPSPQHSCLW